MLVIVRPDLLINSVYRKSVSLSLFTIYYFSISTELIDTFAFLFMFCKERKHINFASLLLLLCAYFYTPAFSQIESKHDSIEQYINWYSSKPVTAKSFIIPASLIATGALGISGEFIISNPEIKEVRDAQFASFHTGVDNYLQFAPIAAGYALLIHNPQHSFWQYTEKVVVMEVMVNGLVQATKRITKVQRPDGSPYAFPSGHTAEAFAGATVFCDEFAQHNTLLSASVYSGAALVGVLRILNNRHWASDVIAGAGVGMLSAKLSELIVEPHRRKNQSFYTYQF